MDELLLIILMIALVINAIDQVTAKNQLFYPLLVWSDHNLPRWLHKPFIGCFICLHSIHGTWIYYLMGGSLELWILVIFASIPVSLYVRKLIE